MPKHPQAKQSARMKFAATSHCVLATTSSKELKNTSICLRAAVSNERETKQLELRIL